MAHVKADYREAELDAATRALLDYAVKQTPTPAAMESTDVETLRAAGLSDPAIHDAAQVVQRQQVAQDGVDLEAEMKPRSA